MSRPGPKGLSPDQKRARGTEQPCRKVEVLFADHASRPDPDELPPPSDMTPAAKKLWKTKVERYRQRGQKIQGFEDALRQYCEIEAALNKAFKIGTMTMAMVTAHRMWAAEFFDTPAAQRVPANGSAKPSNAFARNGKRA